MKNIIILQFHITYNIITMKMKYYIIIIIIDIIDRDVFTELPKHLNLVTHIPTAIIIIIIEE